MQLNRIEQYIDVNRTGKKSETPLHVATCNGVVIDQKTINKAREKGHK